MNIMQTQTLTTLFAYHDGEVSCRLVENNGTRQLFFIQGQLVRNARTGRFVKLSEVMGASCQKRQPSVSEQCASAPKIVVLT